MEQNIGTSGLPLGLARLSGHIILMAASGHPGYVVQAGRWLQNCNEVREFTRRYIDVYGRGGPRIPELLRWLMETGSAIFGTEWATVQLEDPPARMRTPANPIRIEPQVEAAQSLATGPLSAPTPGTIQAQDAMYWARINQFRHTVQVSEAELPRDLIRRRAWRNRPGGVTTSLPQ